MWQSYVETASALFLTHGV